MNRFLHVVAGIAVVCAGGCGDSRVDSGNATRPTPFDAAAAKARAITEATTKAAAESAGSANEGAEEATAEVQPVVYEPPFPGRLDMFEPRKRTARAAMRSDGDMADSVVLMGFATLDTPKAVLAIDGIVKPLANGGQFAGVTVISIEPPRAVLQRGRSRWTASIE